MSTTSIVSIFKRSSPSDVAGTKYRVSIATDATLMDLRTVLTEDDIMTVDDKFMDKGSRLGKSSEASMKWSSITKDGQVQIMSSASDAEPAKNVAMPKQVSGPTGYVAASANATHASGDEDIASAKSGLLGSAGFDYTDPKGVHELSDNEKELLYKNAGLGGGIDISSDKGPRSTGRSPVANVLVSDINFTDCESGKEDIVITYSARASAYAKSGWLEASLEAETPWVTGSLKASAQMASNQSSSESRLYITGRYNYSHCQLTLPYISDLGPHPAFDKAVKAALNLQDPAKRTAELGKVFTSFGHMYVGSVEMGGMKHVTTEKRKSGNKDESSFEAEMKVAIGKKFGFGSAEGAVGGGLKEETKNSSESSFESMQFDTVGGVTYNSDINKWKASLADSANWRVTRTMTVEPVIQLFDEETQAKILAAAPKYIQPPEQNKTPLYRLYSPKSGDHFFTASASERDSAVSSVGYTSEGVAGQILSSQAGSSIPLFRLCNGKDHLYTTNGQERDNLVASKTWNFEGITGYVYATQAAGTVPIYRLYNRGNGDHHYTGNPGEKTNCVGGGWVDEGIAGYFFPA